MGGNSAEDLGLGGEGNSFTAPGSKQTPGGPPEPLPTETLPASPDDTLPPQIDSSDDGDYVIGPSYPADAATQTHGGVPRGQFVNFNMRSEDSAIYKGDDPWLAAKGRFDRAVSVYVPAQYTAGSTAPFMVVQDGGGYTNILSTVLDNLLNAHRLPVMILVFVDPGPGDGRNSERGLEYDTVSDAYVRFVETELLPKVESTAHVKLTDDPEGRATMGGSSGAAAAFTAAWFRPDLYHRVLSYSGTFVNQHPTNQNPHGAWDYHERLLLETPKKPLRVWLQVGENDNNLDGGFGDGYHNWVAANQRMAVALKARGYHYRFVFCNRAGHVDGNAMATTLPDAMAWVWRGYPLN